MRRDERASGQLVGLVIAMGVFILASTTLVQFVAHPPGASTSGTDQENLKLTAQGALNVLLGGEGYPQTWQTSASGVDGLSRLGLLQQGTARALDPAKYDALARGALASRSSNNGFVDYQEAKEKLGLTGYEFHIRASPVFGAVTTGSYGVDGLRSFHIGYVGHWNGNTQSAESVNERADLAYLASVSGHQLLYADTVRPTATGNGDVFEDDSQQLRSILVPLLGSAPVSTVLPSGSANTFHVVNSTTYGSLLNFEAPSAKTNVLALTDGASAPTLSDLGYSNNKEVRVTLGVANMTTLATGLPFTLKWNEFVDTNKDVGPQDDGDYGFVEVSPDGGVTWYPITNSPTQRSQDSTSHPQPPGVWMARSEIVSTLECAPCAGVGEVQVAFHWVANAAQSGYGWLVDDVEMDAFGDADSSHTGFAKDFEKPIYDMLVFGSDVSQNAFTPAEVKYGVRDYVNNYGGRILVLGGEQNTQWLEPLFHVGIAGASGGVSTPDATNPLLTVPNALDYANFPTNNKAWDFSGQATDANLFNMVVGTTTGQDILATSTQGAFGGTGGAGTSQDGAVMLTTYLPFSMSGDQALRFFANSLLYGKYHYLYLDVGPTVPTDVPVGSVTRSATMDKTRDGSGEYTEIGIVMYLWAGTTSGSVTTQTGPLGVPSPPQSVTAESTNGRVYVNWSTPSSAGYSAIQGYRLYRSTTSGAETLLATDTSTTNFTWADLNVTNGVTYYYNLTAYNARGSSGTSSEASATPATAPSAPQSVTASSVLGAVQLSWTAPASNGGAALTAYTIYRGTATNAETLLATIGSNTSFLDATATYPTTYYYKLAAANAAGTSAYSSEASSGVGALPSAPTVTATGGAGSIALAWNVPANGSFDLTGYHVYASSTTGTETSLTWVNSTAGTTTTYTETGLGAGVARYYRVAAVSTAGEGGMSAEATASTLSPPGQPTLLTITQTSAGTLHLAWVAPITGGAPTNYAIYGGNTNGGETQLYWTTASPANVTYDDANLPANQYRSYRVAAYNGAGWSSNVTGSGTTWGLPGAPTLAGVAATGHKVTLTITAPVSDGGSSITSYKVYYCQNAGCTPATPYSTAYTGTPQVVTDTHPSAALQTWRFAVSAVTSVGEGAQSTVISVVTT